MTSRRVEVRRPERWASRLGVVLAVAGSAVGLGNFLRFPGQVMQNGGGAFMVPYFVALALLGLPLTLVEWTMGRHGGRHGLHSTPAILGMVGRSHLIRDVGVLGLLVPFAIYTYYVVIESWCLRYAVGYAAGAIDLGSATETRTVLGGLAYMWQPDVSRLPDFRVWLAAASQVFFTLSVGFGVIVNYASYVGADDDVVGGGLAAAGANEFFEVGLGGLITVPAAFVFLGATGIATSTFGLGFETLPVVFAHMGPVGSVVGATWFAMLFLAAITSSLSMLQPVVAWAVETFGWTRPRAVRAVGGASMVGSAWVLWGSGGLTVLDTLDFWVGSVCIFLLAFVELLTFGWRFGADRGVEDMRRGAALPVPAALGVIIRWVAPCYLAIVFVGFVVQGLADALARVQAQPLAALTLAGVAGVLAAFVVAGRRAVPAGRRP